MGALPEWGPAFLDERRHAVVSTIEPDGSPHSIPIWYLFRDGRLFVATSSRSRKYKNAAARPTATVLVDHRQPGVERWVSATGPVAIVRGDEARAIVKAIHARYLTAAAIQDARVGGGLAAGDDVVLAIAPATWRSWTAQDVDRQYFGGLLTATPEKWFRGLD